MALLSGLANAGHYPEKSLIFWELINPNRGYKFYRDRFSSNPGIPFPFPHVRELGDRKNGSESERILSELLLEIQYRGWTEDDLDMVYSRGIEDDLFSNENGWDRLWLLIWGAFTLVASVLRRLIGRPSFPDRALPPDIEKGSQELTEGSLYGEIDIKLYTLVWLSKPEHCGSWIWRVLQYITGSCSYAKPRASTLLDTLIREFQPPQVPSALELPDESWEIVVLKLHLPALVDKLGKSFPGSHIDQTYDPYEPSKDEVVRFGSDIAKFRRVCEFSIRAENMIRDACPEAAAYYSHLLT